MSVGVAVGVGAKVVGARVAAGISGEDPGKPILHDVFLEVEEGSHVTLTGPSGGGKSTLLKVLATLVPYTSGQVRYKGKELSGLDPVETRRAIAYCYQQPVLFGATVADNLSFPYALRKLPFDKDRAIELLGEVNLPADFLAHDVPTLSGGEKQRVSLARSLLFSPPVLLLDEVTAGLDADNRQIVRALVEGCVSRGTTVVEVTHESSDLALATEIVRLANGTVVNGTGADGTTADGTSA